MTNGLDAVVGTAILGLDTLWGGDVMCPSGTGRFIADSWFSDEALPAAYTHPAAARIRETGGITASPADSRAIDEYLKDIDIPGAIERIRAVSSKLPAPRSSYLRNLADCLQVMFDLVLERHRAAEAVPYERCVSASTGKPPEPSDAGAKRERLASLLGCKEDGLQAAVDAWRAERRVPMASVKRLGAAFIALYDELCQRHLIPYLPIELEEVPRANIQFLPIRDAWFSGSMNYLGRARTAAGAPEYEANYEINASLQISIPEFEQLVSHEVAPGHVTTFAYLQNLYWRGHAGFEATVLTMNTRAATLFEGIANNAILIAHGVNSVDDLPEADTRIGVTLALLQDDAKNQSSYMTWGEGRPQSEVERALRRDFLVSEERASKLAGAWGKHPLLGRMYLPAYRAGTERVAELRRTYPAGKVLPALYGCHGLVDITTIETILENRGRT